jgi:carbohydrate-binding DOMON domain-containing protein
MVKKYQERMEKSLPSFTDTSLGIEPGDLLLRVSCLSEQKARGLTAVKRRKRSNFKDGWSPTLIALKFQHIAILEILGHITGSRKRTIWRNKLEQDIGIQAIIAKWTKGVERMSQNSKQVMGDRYL